MIHFLRSLFRPRAPRQPPGCVYDVTHEGGAVVLTVRCDDQAGARRYVMTTIEARRLSVSLAMAAGAADGRDD